MVIFHSYVKLPEGTGKFYSEIDFDQCFWDKKNEFYLFVEMKTNMISPPKIRRSSV